MKLIYISTILTLILLTNACGSRKKYHKEQYKNKVNKDLRTQLCKTL